MKPNPKYLSFYYQTMTEFPDIELDPKKTALLIIDMQNEFVRRDMGEALQFKEMGEWERWIPFHDRLDNVTIPACKKMLDYLKTHYVSETSASSADTSSESSSEASSETESETETTAR